MKSIENKKHIVKARSSSNSWDLAANLNIFGKTYLLARTAIAIITAAFNKDSISKVIDTLFSVARIDKAKIANTS